MTRKDEMQKIYENHIIHQRIGFETTAKLIGYVIEKMQMKNIIEGQIEITGRIKSYSSAYANSEKKCLDDCFGIRIVGKTNDLIKIKNELEKILVIDKIKDHRKKHKAYNAVHQIAHIKKEYVQNSKIDYDLFPVIEIQYWNPHLKRLCIEGELAYSNYKKTAFNHILKEIEESPMQVFKELPTYYVVRGNKIKQLSALETFSKIYPEIEMPER